MMSSVPPIAVITGVSSGLGQAMAAAFRGHGVKVLGICRSQPTVELDGWLAADITVAEERERVFDRIRQEYGTVDVLVNNAGRGSYATWEELSEADLRNVMELNFFAPIALTKLFLPLLRPGPGTVINIASIAGRLPVPCMGAYCAGKAACALFSETLRMELRRDRVRVLTVMPGRINTGFSTRAVGPRRPPETPGGGNADRFAEQVFRAWRRGKRTLIYPWWYRWLLPLPGWLPGWYERVNTAMWKL